MDDFSAKIMDNALNFAFMTKDTAEKIFGEFVKAGKVSKEEGQKLMEEFVKKFEAEAANLNHKMKAEIKKVIEEFGFVDAKKYEDLNARVTRLETYINELHKKFKD
ncbi:MAG: hypothetical protein A2008_02865 [Candidatus Wallbacteria bacterium GWC2_49_35]|uniref:Poly(3-hydroxyalkanoate) polymerase subunit PhaE n=1 Tax=Candidatus Wallbacteria bacterium GWC2_49_35 TaxID=1817813 RepID=A0A1F7WME1_9BACT|nr:MAG: hypothetical protein A2008_02865 [Candidatus Wallbacteria bacterium GWC2_49_35]HBC73381.1 hypothetical protein [Candidatus Wallbacteria bacterium]